MPDYSMQVPYTSRLALHSSCEKLLAIAAHTVLPTLIPLQGRSFEWGFEYDFISKKPCEEGILLLIAEAMRRLIQENIPFEELSMVPENAAAFLKKSQPLQAENCQDYPASVVPLCKVKDFYDICPIPPLATTKEIGPFALYEMLFLPDGLVRIRGVAFEDKKELKSYLKQVEIAKKHDPARLGKEAELISLQGEEVVWYPKGIECKKYFTKLATRPGYQEIFCHNPLDGVKAIYKYLHEKKTPYPYCFFQDVIRENDESDGLFLVRHATSQVQYTYCQPNKLQEEIISSLQFMHEMASILEMKSCFFLMQRGKDVDYSLHTALKTLGYPFEIRRSDRSQIELHTFDLRGRSWPISKLTLMQETVPLLECVAILSYERLLALELERGKLHYMEDKRTLESESGDSGS